MALPASGQQISFSAINSELGRSATAQLGLDDSELRTLTQTASGAAADLASTIANRARINIVISSNTTGYDLLTACQSLGYVAGRSYITVTINSGVTISGQGSNGMYSTDSWAFCIAGFSTGDKIKVINNGDILGSGGAGGSSNKGPGGMGGNALRIATAGNIVEFINNGNIKGGGGGGSGGKNESQSGGSSKYSNQYTNYATGGQGGGGAGSPGGTGQPQIQNVQVNYSQGANPQNTYGTLPASYSGNSTSGGLGGAGLGGTGSGAAQSGASGGGLGELGGHTDTFTFPWYYSGYIAYGGNPPGWGGPPGWGLYYDAVTVKDAVTFTNNGTVSAIGWGGIYG